MFCNKKIQHFWILLLIMQLYNFLYLLNYNQKNGRNATQTSYGNFTPAAVES